MDYGPLPQSSFAEQWTGRTNILLAASVEADQERHRTDKGDPRNGARLFSSTRDGSRRNAKLVEHRAGSAPRALTLPRCASSNAIKKCWCRLERRSMSSVGYSSERSMEWQGRSESYGYTGPEIRSQAPSAYFGNWRGPFLRPLAGPIAEAVPPIGSVLAEPCWTLHLHGTSTVRNLSAKVSLPQMLD